MAGTITPRAFVLFVCDIQASRAFYETLLGQKVVIDHGPNIGFEGGFALWQAEHAARTIFEHPLMDGCKNGRDNCELYFEAEDIAHEWQRLNAAGAEMVHPLREQPWGQQVFRLYDPDGHIVEIGEPMSVVIQRLLAQGMTAEEVAQHTSMPLEVVQHFAG
jgi:catechol 2,3-dioxygenase-like lactoylglutathione lyase family enzyme